MEKKAMYTETLKTKTRTYFLDLKESAKGNKYLSIAESRMNKEGAFETVRLSIFQEDVPEFAAAMARLVEQFGNQEQPAPAEA